MPEVTVERLTSYSQKDAIQIGKLMPQLSQDFTDAPIDEALLREIIESPYHEQLVARTTEGIVGVASLTIIMGVGMQKKGWLEDFVTDQESGIRGVGQLLWDEMLAWAEQHSIDLSFTSRPSRIAAHAFYKKNGALIRDTNVFEKKVTKSAL